MKISRMVKINANLEYMSLFMDRNNHHWCSIKKGFRKNFAKSTRKHLCQISFKKICKSQPATLLKKIICHRCFPVNFTKFFKNTLLQNTSERLLLYRKIAFFLFTKYEQTLVNSRHQIIFTFLTSCFLINILIPRRVFLPNY